MTNEEIKADAEEMVRYWQRQLRLQDWDFEVIVPAHDPGFCAEAQISIHSHKVKITIRNPAMHPPTSAADPDLEITVVHELVHVRLPYSYSRSPANSAEDDCLENGTEMIAQALVNARRGVER